ncbi:MAG: hypothetical protein HYT03_02380 [Candidatus Harrisonbacteria bacterium]|nr:hypothetical protein [Candidatus Harrisonbacteria bacterium]
MSNLDPEVARRTIALLKIYTENDEIMWRVIIGNAFSCQFGNDLIFVDWRQDGRLSLSINDDWIEEAFGEPNPEQVYGIHALILAIHDQQERYKQSGR